MGATTQNRDQHRDADKPTISVGIPDSSKESLDRQDIFEILSNERRRRVLTYLQQNGSSSDLRTLSRYIAAAENDIPLQQVTSTQRTRTYTALRQSHLPKMDTKGVIDFDPDSGAVQLRQPASDIERYLQAVFGSDIQWVRYFTGVGVAGLLLTIGCVLDVGIFSAVPDSAGGLIASIGVILAGIAQYSTRKIATERDRNSI